MFFYISICLSLSFYYQVSGTPVIEDAFLTVPQIILKNGYILEEHTVVTKDNYILTLFRIPSNSTKRLPILLTHGAGQSTDAWILTGPGHALAYSLADIGYDVWMLNNRGTKYSRHHKYLNSNLFIGKYWDYSWHEIAIYDLPAAIDYILDATNKRKLFYAGFSLGTTTFFVLCSEFPSYNNKIEVFIGLSGVAFLKHTKALVFQVPVALERYAMTLSNQYPMNISPHPDILTIAGSIICADNLITQSLCWIPISALTGYNNNQSNSSLLPLIYGHIPTGVSLKMFVHFMQLANFGRFARFDYGEFENLQRYASTAPPRYNLGNVTAPVYLFHGRGDILNMREDLMSLVKELPNVKEVRTITDPNWAHLDYIFGNSANIYVNQHIINILNEYSNQK